MSEDERRESNADDGRAVTSPLWERIVGLFGGVLVVALAVLVLQGDETRPAVLVTTTGTAEVADTHVVGIEVRNDGGETVRDVLVVGELTEPDGTPVEDAQATVPFLPGGGAETAALVFTGDPAELTLEVRVLGWTDT